ncbi:uncharacterized protein GLRG_10813 [Colletotrichum graminicola M1.001]|uniref:Uncharacterized protein n=1 Tax=Colletotrichum graminicola (strain M1.001 / M2 / FGSC 10212) TaxID=645133 RepID=E3QXR6_COLGM|nr:uncharacterized protein GLRG_10813 [Colletotrichum graminicola M1.001]EFQ35669.1 hypothetical protein GLRG_10813 [Colletotrichum graminicola M1.001]
MSEPPDIVSNPVEGQAGSSMFQENWSFLEDVKKRFEGSEPDVYAAFIKVLSGFYTTTAQGTEDTDGSLASLHETVKALLHGHQDLVERFESSLPQDYLDRQRDVPDHQS